MIQRTTIIAALGAIVLWALPFCSLSAEEGAASGSEEVFDFGSVSAGSTLKHTFAIPNNGTKPLRFKNASSSCDCVQVLAFPEEVLPRKKGRLQVRWFPTDAGPATHDVILESEDAGSSPLAYALKATVQGNASLLAMIPGQVRIPSELLTRKLRNRNPDWAISVDSVLKKLKDKQLKQEIILIDVRDGREFEKFRIPDSLNIPLYAIKTKNFLKHKILILLNEGHGYSSLERECLQLRDTGFTVFIMDGGLNRWKRKLGPLEGNALAETELNRIPPSVFFQEKNYNNWIVLDCSKAKKAEAGYLLPQAVAITSPDNAEKTAAQLKSVLERQQKNPFVSVLIVNDKGQEYEKTEKLIQKAGVANVFSLKGGVEAYLGFLEQQAAILQSQATSKKTIRKCASCP
jgi:rhodanese-related sulfurtransferase